MFQKVLIANRGEIACRIQRTLRDLGIAGVAVYHHEDRDAPHVLAADEAVVLENDVPTAAYLDHAAIIEAARRTGAQAIHPGYGFLSENAAFAEAVERSGLVFIGPDSRVIRLMGDKIRAREFAAAHGIPVAPSAMLERSLQDFLERASGIGFPLLVKAAAGGGGKGMRIVRTGTELEPSVRAAAGEAQRYFADGRVFIERYIEQPRHIEVQVLGDGRGGVVHLFERDCSVQRRYQKIIEESPAPAIPAELRDAITGAATRLASAARYRNAGTVEFILAPDGTFYFLEMNTRLQVEHPVTELVLDVDLVAEQLRIAAGAPLSLRQDDLQPAGHAIECRICAEQPARNFLPATGRIALLRLPAGDGIRFDSGIRAGQTVTPAFDSMLAKLIAHGRTRHEARIRLVSALRQLIVLGVPTNIEYLMRVLENAEFAAGRVHTGLLTQEAARLRQHPPTSEDTAAVILAAALSQPDFRQHSFGMPEPYASIGSWHN
ncbi:MAG TPA: biotin carboxylase N-terminal domain-containing protein [Steroidobacteraceae bacterium]|nr:biotin carboxylase N-terminal domain-containing protein [Steroidobacteraceae bacterium]